MASETGTASETSTTRDRSKLLRAISGPWGRLVLLLFAGAAGAVFAASGWMEGAAGGIVPRCPTNQWLGLYCPACGGTRAVMHLLHGDLAAALRHNPAVVLLLPVAAYLFVAGIDVTSRAWRRWEVATLVLGIVLFTLVRNIPAWPWELLAPPRI